MNFPNKRDRSSIHIQTKKSFFLSVKTKVLSLVNYGLNVCEKNILFFSWENGGTVRIEAEIFLILRWALVYVVLKLD